MGPIHMEYLRSWEFPGLHLCLFLELFCPIERWVLGSLFCILWLQIPAEFHSKNALLRRKFWGFLFQKGHHMTHSTQGHHMPHSALGQVYPWALLLLGASGFASAGQRALWLIQHRTWHFNLWASWWRFSFCQVQSPKKAEAPGSPHFFSLPPG